MEFFSLINGYHNVAKLIRIVQNQGAVITNQRITSNIHSVLEIPHGLGHTGRNQYHPHLVFYPIYFRNCKIGNVILAGQEGTVQIRTKYLKIHAKY